MIVAEVRVETCDNCASLEAKNSELRDALLRIYTMNQTGELAYIARVQDIAARALQKGNTG